MYYDCDRPFTLLMTLALMLLAAIVAIRYERRAQYDAYIERRLAYSRRRMKAIRNLYEFTK